MTVKMLPVANSLSGGGGCSSTSSAAISSHVTGSSRLLVPGRVTAASGIPQGAMTVAVEPELLVGQPDVQQISVEYNSYGTIELDENSKKIWCQNTHWIRAIRLSDDSHTYNIQLRLQPSHRVCPSSTKNGPAPKLILQAVRPIEAGQELLLWFSEDILAMLQVVYLRPPNIQAHKRYVCTRCSALYESPNPLKLHITLACGKYEIGQLWSKLANTMNQQSLQMMFAQEVFDFNLEPEPQLTQTNRQKNALDLSTSSEVSPEKKLYRPYTEPSAFKPFKRNVNVSVTNLDEIPTLWPMKFETDIVRFHQNLAQAQNAGNIFNDDAQIESLVSSLGKAKQGHICLYCGKCYSRKYGLKIHIRTHTGYKPLKCKFCERPFGDPSNLNKHVRLHAEGNTPYKCDLCGKILVRRRDLERHLKSRHMIDMHPGVNVAPVDNVPESPKPNDPTSNDGAIKDEACKPEEVVIEIV